MNAARLKEIIIGTTAVIEDADFAEVGCEVVSLVLATVEVNQAAAELVRSELAEMLKEWGPGLSQGPSFILWQMQLKMIGWEADEKADALRLIALGKVLRLWGVITPTMLDPSSDRAKAGYMAEAGYLATTGFTP